MGRGKTSQSRIRSTAPPRGELFVPPQSLRDSSPGRGKMSRSDKRGSVDLRSKDGEGEVGKILLIA